MRNYDHKLEIRFQMDVMRKKYILMVRTINQSLEQLPSKVVEYLTLEGFRTQLDKIFSNLIRIQS